MIAILDLTLRKRIYKIICYIFIHKYFHNTDNFSSLLLLGDLLGLEAPLEQHHQHVGHPHAEDRAPETRAAAHYRLTSGHTHIPRLFTIY